MISQDQLLQDRYVYTPILPSKKLSKIPYPSDYTDIGPLSKILRAVSSIAKKDNAMIGQALLSVLSAACQVNHQVCYFKEIGNRPISLFILTIAKSGHGKSFISSLCNQGLIDIETQMMQSYLDENRHQNKDKPGPVNPKFIVSSGTIEGILDIIQRNGHCYASIDELSVLLGGHSAKPENIMKLLGTISSLWSEGRHTEVRRSNDEPRQVQGALTFSINGQPEIVKPIFTNPVWREQGTIPRFLVCEPALLKIKRQAGEVIHTRHTRALRQFNEITQLIFQYNKHRIVMASQEAEQILTDFYNDMLLLSCSTYAEIESYALRATEQAARLAAILSIYRQYDECYPDYPKCDQLNLTENDVHAGINLMRYYLHEYQRLSSENFGIDINVLALDLFAEINNFPEKWQTNEKGAVSKTAITRNIEQLKSAKGKLRKQALQLLIEHRYLIFDNWQDGMSRKRERWLINPTIKVMKD